MCLPGRQRERFTGKQCYQPRVSLAARRAPSTTTHSIVYDLPSDVVHTADSSHYLARVRQERERAEEQLIQYALSLRQPSDASDMPEDD